MIVIEAVAQLGPVELEPSDGGPDVRLKLPSDRWVAVEAAYLHPRFESEERRSGELSQWMFDEFEKLGPGGPEVECYFFGDPTSPTGPRRILPPDRKTFLADLEVARFLNEVRAAPHIQRTVELTRFTVRLSSTPRPGGKRPYSLMSGLVQEVPSDASQHALTRVVRKKLDQHKVKEPHIVCAGSDISPVLSYFSNLGIGEGKAVWEALKRSGELSGVFVTSIGYIGADLTSGPAARTTAYPAPTCRYPLTESEWMLLRTLDLNRWKFSWPLRRTETAAADRHRNVSGTFTFRESANGTSMRIKLPAHSIVAALAGQRDAFQGFEGREAEHVKERLEAGWEISECKYFPGDIQKGTAASIELGLVPPYEGVFWSRS